MRDVNWCILFQSLFRILHRPMFGACYPIRRYFLSFFSVSGTPQKQYHDAPYDGDICQIEYSRPKGPHTESHEIYDGSVVKDAIEQVPYASACDKR